MLSADSFTSRLVVGVMTGTSLDGIDASLVRIRGFGLEMRAELVKHISRPLGDLGLQLRAAANQTAMTAGDFARLSWQFGELHAETIAELGSGFNLICVHGQTVFHQPPISWQLVNVAPIAQRLKCPVVSDLRQADLAASGQGAPITPIADWVLFRSETKRRAVLNLGGFCNVTIVPRSEASSQNEAHLAEIRGFDVCACNQILDEVARRALGKPFDENGAAASAGRATPQAAAALAQILRNQREGARSLGTGDEAAQWVKGQIGQTLSPNDIAASAVAVIAHCIAGAVNEHAVDQIIAAGGGARNLALLKAIQHHSGRDIVLSDTLGIPIEARESVEFAILGTLSADGVPITLPQVTGCTGTAPIAGVWTRRETASVDEREG